MTESATERISVDKYYEKLGNILLDLLYAVYTAKRLRLLGKQDVQLLGSLAVIWPGIGYLKPEDMMEKTGFKKNTTRIM